MLELPTGKVNGSDLILLPHTYLFSYAQYVLKNWEVFDLLLLQLLKLCIP